MTIRPEYLKKGDRIYIVAPSCGNAYEPYLSRMRASTAKLESLGFQVTEGENVYLNEGVIASNTPEKQGEEFMKAWASDASTIISAAGGEFMCDVLPHIDFEKIKAMKPKWFMGFSDNTNLTFTLTTLCGIQTVYGPCATQMFLADSPEIRDALDLLQGNKKVFLGYPSWELKNLVTADDPLRPLNLTEKKIIRAYGYKEPFSGMLLGGCLDCLINLCGTRFDRVKTFLKENNTKIIWYLEACDLTPLSIRRAYFELREAGWFDTVSGFLIGRPVCNDASIGGVDRHRAAIDMLSKLGVPILMDVDFGHLAPSMPIINGTSATVSLTPDHNLKIEYK